MPRRRKLENKLIKELQPGFLESKAVQQLYNLFAQIESSRASIASNKKQKFRNAQNIERKTDRKKMQNLSSYEEFMIEVFEGDFYKNLKEIYALLILSPEEKIGIDRIKYLNTIKGLVSANYLEAMNARVKCCAEVITRIIQNRKLSLTKVLDEIELDATTWGKFKEAGKYYYISQKAVSFDQTSDLEDQIDQMFREISQKKFGSESAPKD